MNDIGLILDKEKTLEQIFKVCNYYNIKNKDLADFMDTSEVEVCNWKTNKRFPGWDKIIIFAYVFQIPLDKLVVRKITQENDTVHDIREKIKSIDEKNLIKTIEKYRNSTSISPLEYRNVRWNPLLQDWVSIEEYEETISKILSESL